jgi:hypothetical protein
LGDHLGNVKVLILQMTGDRVTDLKLEWLGVTSWPSCLTYLDNGVVYVGSRMGDPMLVRLNAEKGMRLLIYHLLLRFAVRLNATKAIPSMASWFL